MNSQQWKIMWRYFIWIDGYSSANALTRDKHLVTRGKIARLQWLSGQLTDNIWTLSIINMTGLCKWNMRCFAAGLHIKPLIMKEEQLSITELPLTLLYIDFKSKRKKRFSGWLTCTWVRRRQNLAEYEWIKSVRCGDSVSLSDTAKRANLYY